MSFGNSLFPMLYIRPASLHITCTIYRVSKCCTQCIENNKTNNSILRHSQIVRCALLSSEYICGGGGGGEEKKIKKIKIKN